MPQVTAAYPEGRHKVLTLSYDDGKEADKRLLALFNSHGIKATFHLNSGLLGSGDRIAPGEVAPLYAGHEVAAHSVTHPTIARSPREGLIDELFEDRKLLERLVSYPVRGFSYPNGSYTRDIQSLLPHLGIEYARVVPSTGGFGLPDDWYEWRPTCHHKHDLMKLARQFTLLDRRQYMYMMYVWGHSYEFDDDNNWHIIEEFCEYIGGREDIWYATNIEIVDYMNAFKRLRFSASCGFVYNPSVQSVWLIVDGDPVEVPGVRQISLSGS